MLLQQRLEELRSAIIDVYEDKILLTGFMSEERLLDYYARGSKCMFSTGIYPVQDFNIAYIKDKALFIILENTKEATKYKFLPIKTEVINYKDADNSNRSRIINIRKCDYTSIYNYKDTEKSILFNEMRELKDYIINEYNYTLEL